MLQLSPLSPLGPLGPRGPLKTFGSKWLNIWSISFCEKSLFEAIKIGCREYLIFAAGYDTFAYRYHLKNLEIFEIDKRLLSFRVDTAKKKQLTEEEKVALAARLKKN